MGQTARAQCPLTSFTESFSYLIIMAALASSSNLLTKQPLAGLRRGGGFSLDVPRKKSGKNRSRASRVPRRWCAFPPRDATSASPANISINNSLMADFHLSAGGKAHDLHHTPYGCRTALGLGWIAVDE